MEKSRTQKATLNISTTALLELITFASGLILPKLILEAYGSTYNGIVSSITQFLSLVSLLRLGIAGATRAALYHTLANKDLEGTSSIIKATELYMRKVGVVILIYIAILSIVYPYSLKNDELKYWDIALLVVAAGVGTFAQYFFGITYQTFLTADQSIYIYNVIQSFCIIANTVLCMVFIKCGYSIQVMKFVSASVFVVTPLILNIYVNSKYKFVKNCKPDSSSLSQRKDVMASSIANIIHQDTDIVVLTLFCDIKLVSVYTVYNLVMVALRKIQEIFTTGVEAIFGDMWAKGEYEKISMNLNLFELIIGGFISVAFSCTFLLLLPFVSLYTSGVTDANYILPTYAFVISLAYAVYCFRTPYLVLVQGAGRYKETRNGAYVEAALNIVISVILVQFIGIVGTAIGTLVANVFRTVQYSLYINKSMIKHELTIVLRRMIWIIVNVIATYLIFNNLIIISYTNWISWITGAICIVGVSLMITCITAFLIFRHDFICLIELIKRVIKK